MKVCCDCKEEKPDEEFRFVVGRSRLKYCWPCEQERDRQRYQRRKELRGLKKCPTCNQPLGDQDEES